MIAGSVAVFPGMVALRWLLFPFCFRHFSGGLGSRSRPSVSACGSDISPIELGRGVLLTPPRSSPKPTRHRRVGVSIGEVGVGAVQPTVGGASPAISSHRHRAPPPLRGEVAERAKAEGSAWKRRIPELSDTTTRQPKAGTLPSPPRGSFLHRGAVSRRLDYTAPAGSMSPN